MELISFSIGISRLNQNGNLKFVSVFPSLQYLLFILLQVSNGPNDTAGLE